MDQEAGNAPLALRVGGVTKTFQSVDALAGVDLEVRTGEIHALLGADGAGKSTLFDILLGLTKPSGGTIEVAGRPLVPGSVADSQAAGVAMITEDVCAIPTLSVAENILLSHEPRNLFGFISRKATIEKARAMLAEYGVNVSATAVVERLNRFQRQQVAMVAAMVRQPTLLLLDSLPEKALLEDNTAFFAMLRRLRDSGKTIVIASDRMDDLYGLADRATILCDGRTIATVDLATLDADAVAAGFSRPAAPEGEKAPFFDVAALSGEHGPAGVSFSARLGEVVGVAGRADGGRAALIAALTGHHPRNGSVRVGEVEVAPGEPEAAFTAGIHLVPAERVRKELELRRQIAKDSQPKLFGALAGFGQTSRRGSPKGLGGAFQVIQAVSNRSSNHPPASGLPLADGEPRNPDAPPPPRVLIFDGTTAGLGLGTRAEIAALLRETARQGHVVVLTADEPLELLATCDRIVGIADGRLVPPVG